MTEPSTILKLDQARREAMFRGDIPALTAMFADDSMWIFGDSQAHTKEYALGVVGATGPGEPKLLALDSIDETVRFYGDVAILSAIAIVKTETSGKASEFQARYSIVWAPYGDDWKAVHYQATFVPESA